MNPRNRLILAALFVLVFGICCQATAEVVARCGRGYLENIDGYRVLHLKGTPYEMGYQQGTLLNGECKALLHDLFDDKFKQSKYEVLGIPLPIREAIAGIS